ncbi:hypothetical protein GCM10011585_33080 [Edaphobacter dinghuensis]|uniref:Uncharacterized protein n=1 Tax=Edaphobacter dinghuensis TaxID=1560005 RepID=A0A917HQI4_9BACT|nr:hypothetical protein GCM10011585_33080 [Edaphobacter dinghuensis]
MRKADTLALEKGTEMPVSIEDPDDLARDTSLAVTFHTVRKSMGASLRLESIFVSTHFSSGR